jgi:hypothetical protein
MNQAKQVQIRRGTSAQHALYQMVQGELTLNTTTKRLHIHDGVTMGGFPLARADEVGDARLFQSAGDPNGNKVGKIGDVCVRMDTKSIYIKTSGDNTNTGWE